MPNTRSASLREHRAERRKKKRKKKKREHVLPSWFGPNSQKVSSTQLNNYVVMFMVLFCFVLIESTTWKGEIK